MKILFLHLSDAHFEEGTYVNERIINSQVKAINSLDKFDECVIIFTGDITYSGQVNEYEQAGNYIDLLQRKITEKFRLKTKINIIVIPGNHDINFENAFRDRDEVCCLRGKSVKAEVVQNELLRFDNFYKFAEKYSCFENENLVEVKYIDYEDKTRLQINLINSELFSIFNDRNGDDDKGLHFLPESDINKLTKGEGVNFVVTVSHRGPDWFDWESSKLYRKKLTHSTDLYLYGHEHYDNVSCVTNCENDIIKSIATGLDFKNKKIHFGSLIVNLENKQTSATLFEWDDEKEMFMRKGVNQYEIGKSRCSQEIMEPSYNFINSFTVDNENYNIQDYFEFQGVEVLREDKMVNISDFSEFVDEIKAEKHIVIEGDDFSGKTMLLKNIYISTVGHLVPLYLCAESLTNRKMGNAIRHAFEDQYSDNRSDFEKYNQLDNEKKIVIVDDLSTIKKLHVKSIEDYLCDNFGHVVFVVKPKWDIDLFESVRAKLSKENPQSRYRILPFYSRKRLKLIEKLINIKNPERKDVYNESQKINSFIKDQIKLFSINPKFISMYVSFCIRNTEYDTASNKNVFGKVFENDMVNSIRKYASEDNVDEYLVLLEEIAYDIHFNEKYPLPVEDLIKIIIKYNDEHVMNVDFNKFLAVMINAKIIKEEFNSCVFSSENYLAYFVAKSLNTRYNNNESAGEMELLAKNICFNINGDILLFISYIASNYTILDFIRAQAENHMKDWVEFSIDDENIGFLNSSDCPIHANMPTSEDSNKKDENEDNHEKRVTRKNEIEKVNLYDYKKDAVNTESYKLQQAIQFTELLGKILQGFNHRLKKTDKEAFAKDLFSFPNKIIYKLLRPLDENLDKIVKILGKVLRESEVDISNDVIRESFASSAQYLILNIYNNCARLSVNSKTITALELFKIENTNHKFLHMMMMENLGNFKPFSDEADLIYDSSKLSYVRSMVAKVVRKHYLYNKDIIVIGNAERVAKKYFGKSFNKVKLLK